MVEDKQDTSVEDRIKRVGNWVLGGIVGLDFPTEPQVLCFLGHELLLIPGKAQPESEFGDLYPVVALNRPTTMTFEDGQRIISAFINSVAWVRRQPIEVATFAGGSRVFGLGGPRARVQTTERFALDYLPEPDSNNVRLALALYREGMTVNVVAYQCLSFFKILNLVLGDPKKQIKWIDANLAEARKLDFLRTRDWEQKTGLPSQQTPGEYLYGSNRCAVAHAGSDPTVDPDDPHDINRLSSDLPVVRALAEYLIETKLGVKSAATVYREHLYELDGFKTILGSELVKRITAGDEVPLADLPEFPALSVRLAFQRPFAVFDHMTAEAVDCAGGRLSLNLLSPCSLASVLLTLDFIEERLLFELYESIATTDDGTLRAAEFHLDRLRFEESYIGNGSLEIWSESRRISRCDPFLPMNVDIRRTRRSYNELMSRTEQVIKERSP